MTIIILSVVFIIVFALLIRLLNKKPKRKQAIFRKSFTDAELKEYKDLQKRNINTTPVKKKVVFDTSINPFKIWKRCKRGKKVYWIKVYLSSYRSKFQSTQVIK